MPDTASQPLTLATAQVTGIGGRDANQDALGTRACSSLSCFVVADGAGGHRGGEIASSLVVDSLLDAFAAAPGFGPAALRGWIDQAAQALARSQAERTGLQAMHATVAALLIDAGRHQATWGHLGDTRVYLFRDHRVAHVTRDHSLAQQFIDAGLAADPDPRHHPQRSVLYAALGTEGEVAPVLQPVLALAPGDVLLLCTDGLWELVTEAQMEGALAAARSVQGWLAALCAIADATHTSAPRERDNFTALAVWVGGGT
jgi:serine/threonine protein phosphatase PrpC